MAGRTSVSGSNRIVTDEERLVLTPPSFPIHDPTSSQDVSMRKNKKFVQCGQSYGPQNLGASYPRGEGGKGGEGFKALTLQCTLMTTSSPIKLKEHFGPCCRVHSMELDLRLGKEAIFVTHSKEQLYLAIWTTPQRWLSKMLQR